MTIFLAVLSPVLTLVGVLWTQRRADRRALTEAAKREKLERETLYAQPKREAYVNFLSATSAWGDAAESWDPSDQSTQEAVDKARHELWTTRAAINLLGSLEAAAAAEEYSKALMKDFRGKGDSRIGLSWDSRKSLRSTFERAARADLPSA
ncbi:hypothetical protein [Amycolatopsis sp. cmx-4-61]|uniref:hypothetical protein n=1 Tax=Amycolatopsis sp. cmx-4-61 TaxID=2790937 RepID=UPI00397DF024